MKKHKKFLTAYLIFLAACIVAAAAFLIYVNSVVKKYDRAQPEHVVQQYITTLSSAAKDGTLSQELKLAELCSNRYESNDPSVYEQRYSALLSGELTYEFSAADSSDMNKTYSILSDGEPIGSLRLAGENSRTSLFFFSMADWSVQEYEPFITDTVYNLTVYCPEEVSVTINGTQPSEQELISAEGIPAYSVRGLLNEPKIEYRNEGGAIIPYTTEGNTVKPVLYSFPLRVPYGIAVEVNGKPITGSPADNGEVVYTVCEMEQPKVALSDVCGMKYTFIGDFEADYHTYTVTVPQEYSVKINGRNAEEFSMVQSVAHADAAVLLEKAGVELRDTTAYTFTLLKEGATAEITDENGAVTEYALTEPSLVVGTPTGSDTIPEEIAAQIDVLAAAKTWSKFMTDDLTGDTHGLVEAQQLFIKDSDYYRYAAEWATGPDINFTSAHSIDSFTNESVKNFISYSEDCFSCEVYFEKNMTLYFEERFAGSRTDVFHSIMYFLYIDDTPDNGINDPHWAIAVMHDVL